MNLSKLTLTVTYWLMVGLLHPIIAQSNLSLQLTSEKTALLDGEQGAFTLDITNNDSIALADVVVTFTFQKDFTVLDSTVVVSNGTYDSNWSIANLAAGASETLQFSATSSGYVQFIAEVVSPSSSILVGRCFSGNCYPDDNLKCYYTNCELEADEVLYPQEFAAVEITKVECFPTGDIGCGRNYNITFSNPANTTSAPLNLFLRAFMGEGFYQQTGNVFSVPSIGPNDSLMLTLDFGDCIEDRPFATVQNLQLGLIASEVISLFAGGTQTAPESAFVDLVNTSRCRYNNTTDIAIQVETDGIINADNTATYQVSVINNGDETAESLQITYGRNISRGPSGFPLISYNGTSDYAMSSFSEDEESRIRFLDYDKYWNVQNLAVGETAILEVTATLTELFRNFSTRISVNSNSFLTDPNPANNAVTVEFTRPQTTDLELRLVAEKTILTEGEQGVFSFIIENKGTVAAQDVVVAQRLGVGDFTIVAGDEFTGDWVVGELAPMITDTLTFTAVSNVPYLKMLVEVVQGEDDVDSSADNIISGRCLGGDCFPQTNIFCYYRCELEDDEVLYPTERYDLSFAQVECVPNESDSCSYHYDITIQNDSEISSEPLNLLLYHFINDGAPFAGDPRDITFSVPTIAAQESVTLTADFGACRMDNQFETSSPILILLDDPDLISSYFGRTSFSNERENEINVTRCEGEGGDNDMVDIELLLTTDRPDLAQYESGMFTYTLRNTSNTDAMGVRVELDYGADVVPVGGATATLNVGEYVTLSNSLGKTGIWENITVPANGTASLTLELFSLVTELSFCATVTAMDQEDVDSNPQVGCGVGEDDEAIFTSTPPFIDLELAVAVDNATVFPNAKAITLSLFNNSPTMATGVQVAVDLDETLTGIVDTFYISSHGGTYDPTTGMWTLANLPTYNTAQLIMYVNAAAETFTVFAEVTAADQMDEDSSPNNGSCCTPNEDDETVINGTNPFSPEGIQHNVRQNTSVLIFPNPTQDLLYLNNYKDEVMDYQIIDLFGKVVQNGTLNQNEINVQSLTNGTYFLRLATENTPIRFIKM